ncbi:hypothetical protein TWF481_009856 [Arthrobotrys musiformis]|uniref:Uncharacterized protein n=1 Tax=Arthrobotrys musiformis TaxID=47236 RepID=A0AAV9W6U3_9PEZI
MVSLIALLLLSGYSSAFYIRVQINHAQKKIGPYFLCRNLIKPPAGSNELTIWAINPLETTCATEGGSPEFSIKKPGADVFDFYDELKRDGKIPYNPKTFYISASEPWGTDYNVPIIVIEKDIRAPLALATHIFDPQFPANFEALRGGKVRKDITEQNPPENGDVLDFISHPDFPSHEKGVRIDLRRSKFAHSVKRIPIIRDDKNWPPDSIVDRPPIILTVSNEEQFRAVVEWKEEDYLIAEKLAAYENMKINAKTAVSGFFGGIKNKITSNAVNLKDKVGAGLAKIRNFRHEESKDDTELDPAEKGGRWGNGFNLDYDMDPEYLGPVPEIKPKPPANEEPEEKIPVDIPLDLMPENKDYSN